MKILQIGIPALSFMTLWVVLSGYWDAFHLALGLISVLLVIISNWKLSIVPRDEVGEDIWMSVYGMVRWRYGIFYPLTLLWNITKANLQVAALLLAPRMPIDPVMLTFEAFYKTDAARILLGNSITLTPGTVTLDIDEHRFVVHALSPQLATSLIGGVDQKRIARIFGDSQTSTHQPVILRKIP